MDFRETKRIYRGRFPQLYLYLKLAVKLAVRHAAAYLTASFKIGGRL